jgi:hypothetical protein
VSISIAITTYAERYSSIVFSLLSLIFDVQIPNFQKTEAPCQAGGLFAVPSHCITRHISLEPIGGMVGRSISPIALPLSISALFKDGLFATAICWQYQQI